ncbi:MAG TPA: hypothetical protein VGB81_10980 [Devosia sp.]|jgi:hypothetical protein
MSFREKSAWAMAVVMIGAGLWYLNMFVGTWRELGAVPPPMVVLPYVLLVVVASVVAQVVLAANDPRGANERADERERPIIAVAGNWSGMVLGAGTVAAALHYMAHGDGNLLFHSVMGSLILSSIAEYAFQVALIRRA